MAVAGNTPTASFLTKIGKMQSAGCRLCRIAREARGESTDGLADQRPERMVAGMPHARGERGALSLCDLCSAVWTREAWPPACLPMPDINYSLPAGGDKGFVGCSTGVPACGLQETVRGDRGSVFALCSWNQNCTDSVILSLATGVRERGPGSVPAGSGAALPPWMAVSASSYCSICAKRDSGISMILWARAAVSSFFRLDRSFCTRRPRQESAGSCRICSRFPAR